MKISTGAAEDHPTPLPLDATGLPAVAPPTAVFAAETTSRDGTQGAVRDLTGERLSQLASAEADIAAAQTAGMGAENGRRTHYGQDVLPQGASYGDPVDLPEIPAFVSPPAQSFLYPWQGDEPVPGG